ncbi:hypothetical protein F5Y19DRAFT_487612 [Xylariaceae sp. FL1651]|nr:hypothetical protein F5Y19DRAFT_487612 [Xylariaceae sp. FL1651]
MANGKGSKGVWTADAHEALAGALFRVHGPLKRPEQEAVVQAMKDSGFETTWEGISRSLLFGILSSSIILLSSTTTTNKMPSLGKKWDDTMNAHLFMSIYGILNLSFTDENKADIVNAMNALGYDVNWNGIR